MMQSKRNIFILISIIVVVALIYFAQKSAGPTSSGPQMFSGNLSSVGENSIVVKGSFGNADGTVGQELSDLEIEVDEKTVIKRVAIKIPDIKEVFVIDNLPKTESIVGLGKMKEDSEGATVGIFAKVYKSGFSKSYKALEIEYRTPEFTNANAR